MKEKLKDKTTSARVYERFRAIDIARQGFSVAQIAERSGMHFTGIYDWIERFNHNGFRGFDDPPNPEGRPSLLTSKTNQRNDKNSTGQTSGSGTSLYTMVSIKTSNLLAEKRTFSRC
ncbi:MAG: helix-turn-helix domain-containing protein [Bacteroidota bacterium]